MEAQKCFVPPTHLSSIKSVCAYMLGGGGVKIILNYTFVTWIACCLLCLSSSSLINSAILAFQLLIRHKTSTRHCLFICAFPHFMFLPQRCLFGPRQFCLFIRVSWCMLARFSSHRGSFFFPLGKLWFDSAHGLSVLANYDRTIKMRGTCCIVLFM